jgi:hypothetical protein
VSQLKISDFSGETFKDLEVLYFCMSAMTTQLLAQRLVLQTALCLLKVHLQMFLSLPIIQKCQILSCDTLVANERFIL